jgi:enoyl-CoA hydratase
MDIQFEPADDGVFVVTINRPERMNALDSASKKRLGEVWREAQGRDDVRALVIRGAGEKAFCAGSDIKEVQATGTMVSTEVLADAIPSIGIELTKPMVAALHGFTIGMGLTMAIHCDMRIASPNTIFGFPEVQHGMLSGISAITLPAVIGEAAALDLMLTARKIDAYEALSIGLVHRLADDPYHAALEMAKKMASFSIAAMALTKRLVLAERRRRVQAHFALVAEARDAVTNSKEYAAVVAKAPGSGRMQRD